MKLLTEIGCIVASYHHICTFRCLWAYRIIERKEKYGVTLTDDHDVHLYLLAFLLCLPFFPR
jgi:hypothetical protein